MDTKTDRTIDIYIRDTTVSYFARTMVMNFLYLMECWGFELIVLWATLQQLASSCVVERQRSQVLAWLAYLANHTSFPDPYHAAYYLYPCISFDTPKKVITFNSCSFYFTWCTSGIALLLVMQQLSALVSWLWKVSSCNQVEWHDH